MESFLYLSSVIALLALATFATRLLPFVLLYKVADHPVLTHLGRYLPAMVMVLLVLYAIKQDVTFSTDILAPTACLALVALLHVLFRQALLSIVAGTAAYMTLVQMGWTG
ncbi:branched-chain amino acid transporter AzlD [Bacterioplanes sanyensis]|uniref:branched-chain amino acid transporter permease n=1 Tax=Bacterioplanes sanyensis TaxID=1249553 RepID=UPI00167750A7|nr:AzlD domain-containing protein [Bacterioplanes sanyensis]GGY55749.1 branched-chain amino acid transporter AzlD [Bacterioplanes sanyensis]